MSKRKIVNTPLDATTERASRSIIKEAISTEPLIFGKQNYLWMGIGALLIAVGLLLMLGGQQPNPEAWDPNITYNFRIITLAPIVILAGLAIEIYAIFKD